MYAKAVGRGSSIVVSIAVEKTEKNSIMHPKSVTGIQKKEKSRIGRMKKKEEKNKNLKKPWMIGLQQ